jgi:hypothetical protein
VSAPPELIPTSAGTLRFIGWALGADRAILRDYPGEAHGEPYPIYRLNVRPGTYDASPGYEYSMPVTQADRERKAAALLAALGDASHVHDTDAGGNCRTPRCSYNSDAAHADADSYEPYGEDADQ